MENKNKIIYNFVIFILIFTMPLSVLADENETIGSDDWADNSITGSFDYNDIAVSDDGTIVIVGGNGYKEGKITYSNDGIKWEKANLMVTTEIVSCDWGNDCFVAIGENGSVLNSKSGANWELVFKSKNITLTDVVYGNNGFIAIGGDEVSYDSTEEIYHRYLYHSTDGVNWKQVLKEECKNSWGNVTFLNNIYIVHNSYGDKTIEEIAYSEDGINWTIIKLKTPIYNKSLYWDGDKYISVGINSFEENGDYVFAPQIFTSLNLVDWKRIDHNINEGVLLKDIAYQNGKYIISAIFCGESILLMSKDIKRWEEASDRHFNKLKGVEVTTDSITFVGEQGTFINIKDNILKYFENEYSKIVKIIYNGDSYIALAENGIFYKSEDGETWVKYLSNMESTVRDGIWVKGKYYATRVFRDGNTGGYNTTEVYSSLDGIVWERLSTIGESTTSLHFVNGKYFILGSGNLYWSDDGINWTEAKIPKTYYLNDIEWFKGKYYAVGSGRTVIISEDGEMWEKSNIGHGNDLNDIATNGESMILVGDFSESCFTTDGINWNDANGVNWTYPDNYTGDFFEQVLWDGNDYVIFVCGHEIYYKTKDGTTLEKYETNTYKFLVTACWDGNRYILGGWKGEITSFIPKDFIKVKIKGKPIIFDVAPKVINNRTMIPAREVFEKVGAEVLWDNDTRSVVVIKDDITINIQIGSDTAIVNGINKVLDSPAVIVEGRTLVPVRFIAEELGMSVKWDGETKTVIIE